jgi:hypothetical protein
MLLSVYSYLTLKVVLGGIVALEKAAPFDLVMINLESLRHLNI